MHEKIAKAVKSDENAKENDFQPFNAKKKMIHAVTALIFYTALIDARH